MKKTTTSEDQETYISEENETCNPRKNMALVKLVISEAQKLIVAGKNAKFTCENKLQEHAAEDRLNGMGAEGYKSRIYKGGEYDLACQVIAEAKKIIKSGRNARIGCADAETETSDQKKRREYYRWKRMNRS